MQNTLKNESMYNYMRRNQIVNNEKFYSGSLACFSMVPVINKILVIVFPSLSGKIMSILYLLIGLFAICASIRVNGIKNIPANNILVFLIVLVYFLISDIMKVSSVSYVEIIVYTFLPLLFFYGKNLNTTFYLETCLIIGTLGLPLLNRIFILQYGAAEMGVSYAFLLSALVSITYLIRKKKSVPFVILSIMNLIYAFELIFVGSRGCVLSIFLYILIILLIKPSRTSSSGIEKPIRSKIILLLLVIMFFSCYQNIFNFCLNIFDKIDVRVEFLYKIKKLSESDNILNGRKEIFDVALNGFLNSPFIGNGIDSFDFYTGLEYPHNSVLQLLFDMGLLGAIPILFLFLKGIKNTLKKGTHDEIVFLSLIFFSSVPGSLFSHDLWKDPLLWMTVSMAIYLDNSYSKKQKNNIGKVQNEDIG